MTADVEHLHHRLAKAGLSTRRVAMVLCATNAVLVVFGLLLATFQSHAYGIFLLALLVLVYVLLRHMAVIELRETGRVLLTGLRRPAHSLPKALAYPLSGTPFAWRERWRLPCGSLSPCQEDSGIPGSSISPSG